MCNAARIIFAWAIYEKNKGAWGSWLCIESRGVLSSTSWAEKNKITRCVFPRGAGRQNELCVSHLRTHIAWIIKWRAPSAREEREREREQDDKKNNCALWRSLKGCLLGWTLVLIYLEPEWTGQSAPAAALHMMKWLVHLATQVTLSGRREPNSWRTLPTNYISDADCTCVCFAILAVCTPGSPGLVREIGTLRCGYDI
jgi:hypothetical protein